MALDTMHGSSKMDAIPAASSSSSTVNVTSSCSPFKIDPSDDGSSSMVYSSSDWKYVVFLSFRGEDTRHTFTSHLYKALDQQGIETFMDDKRLQRGEEISPTLVTAIERSRCSIIVLSENYAYSKWCLEELAAILECKTTKKQRVVPIFYNVDPSHVRSQSGSFGEALAKHEKISKIKVEKVQRWREALTQVANISGFHSVNKPEAQLIEEIVTDISKDLNCVLSEDDQNLVGVDSCIKEVESLLCLESADVQMIGIWGMGGIGKTTLAKAIYKRISSQFEGSCFLANVGDLASKGEDYLKKELLLRVLKDRNVDVTITSIKARLHSKKVLIVVDNVNHRSILKSIVGGLDWFGPHSRILITTRDKQFLTLHGISAIYEVQKLPDDKATELFNNYAFRNNPPTEEVMEFSQRVISYAQGLPLALEVLACSLCNKSRDEWECALTKLEKIPNMEIQKVLQISFEELDDNEKNIFLDIAFFFKEDDKDVVAEILKSCGFSPDSGIRTLIDKCLVNIFNDELHMHDLLQEMGREVVRRTSPKEPGKRSRLCVQQDICHILEKNTGTEEVEIIWLDLCGLKEICFSTEAFDKMNKLRLLGIYDSSISDDSEFSDDTECSTDEMKCNVHISDGFKFHYDELRCLYWHEYTLHSLSADFESKNILFLAMPYNHLQQLWIGDKAFESLKCMDLSYSKYLTETPDLSRVPSLVLLNLQGCTNLHKIHPSLRDLEKLTVLSLKNCISLEYFPGIGRLVSLETLVLSGCSNLKKFPEISQHLPCLSELHLDETGITKLPSSIGYATELILLDLKNCKNLLSLPSSIRKLTCLETLSLSGCSNLGKGEVNSGNFDALPRGLYRLCNLQKLELQNCKRLEELPALPSSMELVNASNCKSLEFISPHSVFVLFGGSLFGNCFKLWRYRSKMEPHIRNMATHVDKHKWRSTYDREYPKVQVPFSTVFPGSTVPNWFMHRSEGNEINMEITSSLYTRIFLGFAVSAVIAPEDKFIRSGWFTYCTLDSHDPNSESESSRVCSFTDANTCRLEDITIKSDHLWLAYVPSFLSYSGKKWSYIKFSFCTSRESCIVKRCGVCPVYVNCRDDEWNSNGSVPGDDLREWKLEDTVIKRGLVDERSRGIGHSHAQSHAWDREKVEMQPNHPPISQTSNDVHQGVLEDTQLRWRSPQEVYHSGADSYTWEQQRLEKGSINASISNTGTAFWVFIAIFTFLFIAHICHWVPFRISPLIAAFLLFLILRWH